jgi:hypothetical protein
MSNVELVTVGSFANRIEAEMAQGALEAAGIESMILADDAGGQYAALALTGVRLLVHAEDMEQARDILSEHPPVSS